MHVCVCVCVCVRERERERDREKVCVYVYVCVCQVCVCTHTHKYIYLCMKACIFVHNNKTVSLYNHSMLTWSHRNKGSIFLLFHMGARAHTHTHTHTHIFAMQSQFVCITFACTTPLFKHLICIHARLFFISVPAWLSEGDCRGETDRQKERVIERL